MKSCEYEKRKAEVLNNPRHAKVKSKRTAKSKHKHEQHDFLISFKEVDFSNSNIIKPRTCRASLCIHCGKVYNIFTMECERANETRRIYRVLHPAEIQERYGHLNHFDLGITVRHSYELHDQSIRDIRDMYQAMISNILSDEYIITDDDVTYGLANDIKPEEMAKLILNRRKD